MKLAQMLVLLFMSQMEKFVPQKAKELFNGVLPVADAVCPKDGEEPKLKAFAGVLEAPKAGALLAPNVVVPEDPKPGVVVEPKGVELNVGVLEAPNRDVDVEPNAGVVVAPKDGVVVPKAV
ncbi:hypothetical protein ZWY2020_033673 [Hordeum vulgare]|nr:hypothetical protein ZWY2020_033673 [Hordeum vulgare]